MSLLPSLRPLRSVLFGSLLIALPSCGEQADRDEVQLFDSSPAALEQHLVWIDSANGKALSLDVGGRAPAPRVLSYDVPADPVSIQRRNGHNELLLLARGNGAGDGTLEVLGGKGVDRSYLLGTRFSSVLQSEDGRFAFTSFLGVQVQDADSLLFDPNEIALIDLTKEGDDAITHRSLRGFGSAPKGIVFSPEMDLAGEVRRIAVVLFDSHVSLIDLNHPTRPEYTVELSRLGNIGLHKVRFSPEENKIYLLGTNSTDIFVLTLLPAGDNRENDYEPSRNQLGATTRPTDMALYQDGGENRLLAVSGSNALIIEAGSNRVTEVPLAAPAESILMYEGPAPFDDAVERRALLYSVGSQVVTFLDLDDVEERTTRNRETLRLSSAITGITPLKNNLVLVMRNSGLSMLDLTGRTASELSSQADLGNAIPSPELSRLWINPLGYSALAYLDFAENSSTTGQVSLDAPISGLFLFTDIDKPRIALTHDKQGGAVTLLSATEPDDMAQALTLRGFFYPEILDH